MASELAGRDRPVGRITRGTTNVNRLRRVDRWIAAQPVVRTAEDPLVVDLGYGASATTTLELRDRLAAVRPDVRVIGVEIDPERVRIASAAAEKKCARFCQAGGRSAPNRSHTSCTNAVACSVSTSAPLLRSMRTTPSLPPAQR